MTLFKNQRERQISVLSMREFCIKVNIKIWFIHSNLTSSDQRGDRDSSRQRQQGFSFESGCIYGFLPTYRKNCGELDRSQALFCSIPSHPRGMALHSPPRAQNLPNSPLPGAQPREESITDGPLGSWVHIYALSYIPLVQFTASADSVSLRVQKLVPLRNRGMTVQYLKKLSLVSNEAAFKINNKKPLMTQPGKVGRLVGASSCMYTKRLQV